MDSIRLQAQDLYAVIVDEGKGQTRQSERNAEIRQLHVEF